MSGYKVDVQFLSNGHSGDGEEFGNVRSSFCRAGKESVCRFIVGYDDSRIGCVSPVAAFHETVI